VEAGKQRCGVKGYILMKTIQREAATMSIFHLLHISDLHGVNPFPLAQPQWVQHTIITGDMADNGDLSEYETIALWYNAQPAGSVSILPGNHDVCKGGNIYDDRCVMRWKKTFGDDFFMGKKMPLTKGLKDEVLSHGGYPIHIVQLNSVAMTVSPFDFAQGEIGTAQLNALDVALTMAQDAGAYIILALHHHPFIHGETTMRLIDSSKLLSIVHGRVNLMLFGHQHIADHWVNRWGIPHILAAPGFKDERWGWRIDVDLINRRVQNIQPTFV